MYRRVLTKLAAIFPDLRLLSCIVFLAIYATSTPVVFAQQPLVSLLQANVRWNHVPLSKSECVVVSNSGRAEINVWVQNSPKLPRPLDTYTLTLTEDQFTALKRALQSADIETLPTFKVPKPTAVMDQTSTFAVVTFAGSKSRKIGYVELQSADGSRVNDGPSSKQVDIGKQALGPVQRWLSALDYTAAIHQSTPTGNCPGFD